MNAALRCPHCGKSIDLDAIPSHDLLALVAKNFGLTVEELTSRSQSKTFVNARRYYAELARAKGLSYASIGNRLHRDHSTIVYLLRRRP